VASRRVGARPIAEVSEPRDPAEFGAWLAPYLAGLIAAVSLLYFYMGIRSSTPYGIAGLYTLMSDLAASHGYVLPMRVPYYGPGGIPFVYPPLATYTHALVVHTLGVSNLFYLRFAPICFTILCLVPLSLLFWELSRSRLVSALAALFTITNFIVLVWQIHADGTVRTFALLWTLVGLWFAVRAMRQPAITTIGGAALSLAAAIASHPEYPVFFIITLVALILAGGRREEFPRRVGVAAAIVGGGLVLSAAWWAVMINRYGISTLLYALHTHGGVLGGSTLQHPWTFPFLIVERLGMVDVTLPRRGGAHVLALFFTHPRTAFPSLHLGLSPLPWWPEYALGLYGVWKLARARQWFLPLWFVLTLLGMGEAGRFIAIIVALLAAIVIRDALVRLAQGPRRGLAYGLGVALLGCVLLFSLAGATKWTFDQKSGISMDDLRMGQWMQANSAPNSIFLPVTSFPDYEEWYPYLFHRTPDAAFWGAEWTSNFDHEIALTEAQDRCVQRSSLSCLERLVRTNHIPVNYLIISGRQQFAALTRALNGSGRWSRVYHNQTDSAWRHRSG